MKLIFWIKELILGKSIRPTDVFTPATPATLTYIKRRELDLQIDRALATKGKQLVIYGHSGSGKTTLIKNKLEEGNTNYIKSICSKDYTYEKLLREAIFKIRVYFNTEIVYQDSAEIGFELSSLEAIAKVAGKTGQTKGGTYKPAVDIELSTNMLGEALCKSNTIWIIEDFHKVGQKEKDALADNIKIIYDTGAVVIAIGAVGEARAVVDANRELGNNRVAEIVVPLMLDAELEQIMYKGETLLNVEIAEAVKHKIIKYSFGLASICHQLCLNLCYVRNIKKPLRNKLTFDLIDFDRAVDLYLQDASDTLKKQYDNAIRIEDSDGISIPKEILLAILSSELEEVSFTEIISLINENASTFDDELVRKYLLELISEERGVVIRYDNASNKYSLSDPFFVTYFLSRIQQDIQTKSQLN